MPLACAAFGAAGIALQYFHSAMVYPFLAAQCQCYAKALYSAGGAYFLVLGAFTLTGGFTSSSIFDRLYNVFLRPLFKGSPIPPQGAPRRFGCAIGGLVYIASGAVFLLGSAALAYGLAAFMIVFALVAGITQWCFASTLHKLLFAKK